MPSSARRTRRPLLTLLVTLALTSVTWVSPLAATADPTSGQPSSTEPAAAKVVPSSATPSDFPTGTLIVDMGASTQTIANGLKPYGFVYEMLTTYKIPVSWAIKNGKTSVGAGDFTATNLTELSSGSTVSSKTFSGSAFLVSGHFVNEIPAARLTYWKGQGVRFYQARSALTNLPQLSELRSWPRIVLDADSGAVADEYYANAGIPSTAYRTALPSALTSCDDLFVFPHADPTWTLHKNLRTFNNNGGYIFGQCHAPSVLENIDDPADAGTAPDLNFLSTNGLVGYDDHSNGTLPYSYHADWSDPVLQVKGGFDEATQNGSEQVYLPKAGGWRATTKVLAWDPDHPQLAGSSPVSPGKAAISVYGRGFGNAGNGLVMYQGGHDFNKKNGDASAQVAAQRAFMNFNLLAGIDRGITATTNIPNGQITGGATIPVVASATGGSGTYTYQWTSTCGGTFANSSAASTTFTAPTVVSEKECTLRVTVTDSCGRVAFSASGVPVQQSADLSITKTDGSDPIRAGDAVTYTLTATNRSTITDATSVVVTDVLDRNTSLLSTTPSSCTSATSGGVTTVTCALGTLTKGASRTVTIRTQSSAYTGTDSYAGSTSHDGSAATECPTSDLCNRVTISSPTADPVTTNNSYVQPTNVVRAGIVLAKTVTDSGDADTTGSVGETLTYAFTVTNTGVLPLTNVKITDPMLGLDGAACVASLAAGASSTCPLLPRQTYVVKSSDVIVGTVSNTAGATATPSFGADVVSSSTAEISTPASPAIRIAKTVADSTSDADTLASFGERLTYGFSVTNTGNVPLTDVTVSDPMLGLANATCVSSLAVGATSSCPTLTLPAWTTTAADVETGEVRNTASGSGTAPSGAKTTSSGTAVIATEAARTSLAMTKHVDDASDDGLAQLGEELTYKITVSNTGNLPLTDVTLTDPLLGLDKAPCVASLPVGASTSCPGLDVPAYTVKPSDVDKGSIANTATTSGTTAKGAKVTASASDTIPAPATPALRVVKKATDASGDGRGALGEKVTYDFTVTNTGNVPLTDVTVTDALLGLDKAACVASLAVGASTTCPSLTVPAHTVTAADAERGSVTNTATVAGKTAKGASATATDAVTVPVPAAPGISLVKTVKDADNDRIAAFKERLTYSFKVTNTGNLPLTGVTITDAQLGLDKAACVDTLAVGASTTCPGLTVPTYKVTDDDVDHGSVDNTATTAGTSSAGGVSAQDKVTLPTETDKPAVALVKNVVDADGDGIASLGEKLRYTFTVSNTGNVRLLDLTITDDMLGLDKADCVGNLRGDTSVTCTVKGTHVVTVEDVDNGIVRNTATVRGVSKKGKAVSDKSTATIGAPAHPSMTLRKTVADDQADADEVGSLGEDLAYTFTVTNTGDTTLRPVTITDAMLGLSSATCVKALAPGDSTKCPALGTTTHRVAAEDVNRGRVDNTATAHGTSAAGEKVSATDVASMPTPAAPALGLTKTVADSDDVDAVGALGETLTYTFTVANPGNVALADVRVSDAMLGLSSVPCVAALAPGETATCAITGATHKVTSADVANGRVDNTATATAKGADGSDLTTSHGASIGTEGARAGVSLLKTVVDSADADSTGGLGEKLTYTFTVTNTGNVDLTGLTVTDAKLGLSNAACAASLAPGATTTCSLPADRTTYTVTTADLERGSVDNTAEVTGRGPGSAVAIDRSSASIDSPAHPRLELVKTVRDSDDADSVGSLGEKVTYTFSVTNSGDVPLTGVTVTDAKLGLKDAACVASLAPGATAPCPQLTVPAYTVTAADLSAGTVENTATATGKPSSGGTTSATASANLPTVSPLPAVGLRKTVTDSPDADSIASGGERLTYGFTVTNNGNVPLSDVTITDLRLKMSNAPCVASLAVGASTTCPLQTVPAYTVTAADLATGRVDNTATVRATPAAGQKVSESAYVSIPTETAKPSIALVKTVRDTDDADTVAGPGERLTYTFTVTNNGNQQLTDVTIDDGKLGLSGVPCVDSLAPGATATCATAPTYTTQDADLQQGKVDNTATAKAKTPSGGSVSANGSASIPTQETGEPPVPTGEGFNWDWRYDPPTCDALTVVYPADLPPGQSNDVNIRFRDDRGQQFTLNFHDNEGFWSGQTSFRYREHPQWPASLTSWTVEWTQVGGTNYHWEGAVRCQLVDGVAVAVTTVDGWGTGGTTVDVGDTVNATQVTVSGNGGQPVLLEKREGDGAWSVVKTFTVGTTGRVAVTFPRETKKGSYGYRLRVDPTAGSTGTTTGVRTVTVR